MELGAGQAPRVRTMIAERDALEIVRFEKDFQGISRVAIVRRKP
jgi:hypothetical protein